MARAPRFPLALALTQLTCAGVDSGSQPVGSSSAVPNAEGSASGHSGESAGAAASTAASTSGSSSGATTDAAASDGDLGDTDLLPPSPFSFLIYGDTRAGGGCEGNAAHLRLVERMVTESNWDFVVHLGDMTTGYDASTCFTHAGDCTEADAHGNFAEQIAPLRAKDAPPGLPTAFIPVVGNHDDNHDWVPDACGDRLCDVFDVSALLDHPTPAGDPCGADFPDQLYYSFRYRGVLFVVLRVNDDYHDLFACNGFEAGYVDCADYCANAPSSPTRSDRCYNVHQYDWLRELLGAADGDAEIRHRIVLLHAPLYTSYDDHAPTASFGALVPLLEEHDVDFVFNGHNHTYERTVPIRADDAADDGVVYITTGHGGSEGGGPLGAWFTAAASGSYHYMRIDVDDGGVHGVAIDLTGNTIDAF